MHVALDRRDDKHAGVAVGARDAAGLELLLLNEWDEVRDGTLHDARRLDHLRQGVVAAEGGGGKRGKASVRASRDRVLGMSLGCDCRLLATTQQRCNAC